MSEIIESPPSRSNSKSPSLRASTDQVDNLRETLADAENNVEVKLNT
jgi:hypothetical protein